MNNSKTFLFTGRPCAGKTTLVKNILNKLEINGNNTVIHYDGDSFRKIHTPNLGFSEEDRRKNLEILSQKAREANKNGKIVFASFVSPTENVRNLIKELIGEENFVLVHVKCSLNSCEKRDVKGMYAEARAGKRKNFTGIDSPFEEPLNPHIIMDTENYSLEQCVKYFIEKSFLLKKPEQISKS